MDKFRTPDDEISRPGYFYPPFHEGHTYQGVTYGGHTDFAVDWNRRTPLGGWLEDKGEPVLAAADGTVAEIDKANGVVLINHYGGLWRTEYRHMDPVMAHVGQKVKRGDQVGKIGAVGISPDSGFTPSPHLHHLHWQRDKTSLPWRRVKQRIMGSAIAASVFNSDSQPKTWDAPGPSYVVGQPLPVTWEEAYNDANAAYVKADARADALRVKLDAAEAEIAALKAGMDQEAIAAALGHAESIVGLLEPLTGPRGS